MLQNVLRLFSRSLLRVNGTEAEQFLQGLITKDIRYDFKCFKIMFYILKFL